MNRRKRNNLLHNKQLFRRSIPGVSNVEPESKLPMTMARADKIDQKTIFIELKSCKSRNKSRRSEAQSGRSKKNSEGMRNLILYRKQPLK